MTGQELIMKWVAFIRRYVALTDAQALTVALWAINTWTYRRFYVVPYLEIWAEGKRSGKSTLGEVLSGLCNGGRVLATVRTLSMVKLIEAKEGNYTPFIEEAERFWNGPLSDERSILASGYRRGAVHELEKGSYSTYCPKAFILIGNVHDILRDRCISIKMGRSKPERNWTVERNAAMAESDDLIVGLREVFKSADVVRTADGQPNFKSIDPEWLTNARDREIWTPLFSIAGSLRLNMDTMRLLKRASMDLSLLKTLPTVRYHPSQTEQIGDDQDAADAVLADLLKVIADGETFIPTEQAINRLQGIDEAPWRAWRGDGVNALSLAALLGRFGIASTTGQVGKGRKDRVPCKGYKVADLRKASAAKH